MLCLLKERQCPFAYTSQLSKHGFLVTKLGRRRHDRRDLAFDHARFDQSQRKMETLVEGYGQRCFSDDAAGVASNTALDITKVPSESAC